MVNGNACDGLAWMAGGGGDGDVAVEIHKTTLLLNWNEQLKLAYFDPYYCYYYDCFCK